MWSLANKTYTKSYSSAFCGASNIFCFTIYVLIFALPFILGSFQKCKQIVRLKILRDVKH